jgi:hypothetical protein
VERGEILGPQHPEEVEDPEGIEEPEEQDDHKCGLQERQGYTEEPL